MFRFHIRFSNKTRNHLNCNRQTSLVFMQTSKLSIIAVFKTSLIQNVIDFKAYTVYS